MTDPIEEIRQSLATDPTCRVEPDDARVLLAELDKSRLETLREYKRAEAAQARADHFFNMSIDADLKVRDLERRLSDPYAEAMGFGSKPKK